MLRQQLVRNTLMKNLNKLDREKSLTNRQIM